MGPATERALTDGLFKPVKSLMKWRWSVAVWWTAAVLVVATFATPYMCMATLAYALMVTGFLYRRNRLVHVRLMSSAMLLDVALVIVLELQRGAVETAAGFQLSLPQQVHIFSSLMAVLLYGPIAFWGWRRYRNLASEQAKGLHFRLGVGAFIFRTIGFFTMFSMLWKG